MEPAVAREASALEYFERILERFRCAANPGALDREFTIAGRSVLVRVLGAGERMTLALEHLAAKAPARGADGSGRQGAPDLTIAVWDAATSGLPAAAWRPEDLRPRGEIRGFGSERVRAYFQGACALAMVDLGQRQGLYLARSFESLPYYELSAPFRSLFHAWAETLGLHLVHAAAVGLRGDAVLLAARGGGGKSTAALLGALAGLDYLGDDYCLVGCKPPSVFSLYSSAKVEGRDASRFPALASCLWNPDRLDTEKALFFLAQRLPQCIRPQARLRLILVPRFSDADRTTSRPASPADALRALAPSTIFQQPGAGASSLHFLGRLVRRVPCRFLDLGADRDSTVAVIAELLSKNA